MTDVLNGSTADSSQTASTSSPTTSLTQSQPAGGGGWLTSLPEELKGVAETKGWKEPADALRSYQHLEQAFGADRAGRALIMPKDGEDKEGYDRVYKALGRPDTPEGYEIKSLMLESGAPVDETDTLLAETMSGAMHEAGLSMGQAKKLAEAFQGVVRATNDSTEQAFAAELEAFERKAAPADLEAARRGFRFFGLDKDEAGEVSATLVRSLGPERAVKMFAQLGRAMGEDKAVEGGGNISVGSAAGASRRMDQLLSDPAFTKRYQGGDQSAMDEMDKLSKIIASGR